MKNKINSWHIGIAAEAIAAGQFARLGYDVLVQYGANQAEYDLVVTKPKENYLMKISVKGSQDGSWGLTMNYKKDRNYHQAADAWLKKHEANTVFCFLQFQDTELDEMPRIYLATSLEVSKQLKSSRNGIGDTILHEKKVWGARAAAAGSSDQIPDNWKFSQKRIEELFEQTK